MTKMLLPVDEVPQAISESVATTLRAHMISMSPELLGELGRNVAQALFAIDELLMQPSAGDMIMVGHTLRALAATGKPNAETAPTLKSVGDWLVQLVTEAKKAA